MYEYLGSGGGGCCWNEQCFWYEIDTLCCFNKIPDRSNTRKEGFILLTISAYSPLPQGRHEAGVRQPLTLCPQSGSKEMNGCSRPYPTEVCRLRLRLNCPHQSTQCRKSLRHAQRLVFLELLHPEKWFTLLSPHLHVPFGFLLY